MARKKTVQAEADLEVKVNIDELQPLDPEPIEIGDIEMPEPAPVKTVPILARSLGLRSPQDDNHAVKTFLFVSQAITAAGTGGATQIDTPQPVVSFSIPERTYSRIDELEVDIRPVQDLHGYTKPWPPGGGKNLFGGVYNVRFTFAEPIPSGTVISVSGSTTTSDNTRCNLYNAVGTRFQNFGLNDTVNGRKVRNGYTLADDAYEVLFDVAEADKFQIEIASTATSYAPYSNICPISGRDSVSVTRTGKNLLSPKLYAGGTYNPTVGTVWNLTENPIQFSTTDNATFTINTEGNWWYFTLLLPLIPHVNMYISMGGSSTGTFGRTYGYLDKNFTVLSKDNTTDTSWTLTGGIYPDGAPNRAYFYVVITNRNTSSTTLTITNPMVRLYSESDNTYEPYVANKYDITIPQTVYGGTLDVTRGKLTVTHGMIASYNGEPLPGEWISDRDVYAEGTTPTIGAQVVYELETPIILHLTPVGSIPLLEGQNNIFADTGDILRIAYSYENMI